MANVLLPQIQALMFEAALDIPADSLLKPQMKYNMHTARKDNALVEKAQADSQSCSHVIKQKCVRTIRPHFCFCKVTTQQLLCDLL